MRQETVDVRARPPKRLPVVLTSDEVERVLAHLGGVPRLVCTILYGSGLRLLEALQLRWKALDFGPGEITVRDGKGRKDRLTMLPNALHQPLQEHLGQVRQQHEADLKRGLGRAPLPDALIRKYPNAGQEWGWQWVFPASSCKQLSSRPPGSGPDVRPSRAGFMQVGLNRS
ncbi:MAG: tyrosine-type recombinase/integrase [Acidobacteria bacterium]|nr:tyrosine-type recombinase/integrase [Acidobacteriota bacterium]